MESAESKTRILICTNGFEGTWPAVEYGAWVAGVIHAPITLLGIQEEDWAKQGLEVLVERASDLLKAKGLEFTVESQAGKAEEIIPQKADSADFITLLGPLGRPLLQRLLVGRSIRGLLEEISSPVLYVRNACLPMKRMLLCLGGLGYEVTAEHLAVRLAKASGAEATLLHIAPHVDLDYPTARAEKEHWKDLEKTDTLTGRNLRKALDTARQSGLKSEIKMRQGNVVEEIVAELKGGSYDLICMGSRMSARGLRQLYEPNVTDEIAEQAECPLLTARFAPEGVD
jgi:nucleotide-binding universal stress UspA family protein